MRILGIESSCDETAMALVSENEGGIVIEKSLVASQIDLHKIYGGVVPEVAAREHVSAIFPMLLEMGISRDGHEIDAIAVTAGPGLVAALRIGVELAKTLAWMWNKPLVAANHLEGHVYSVWGQGSKSERVMECKSEGKGKFFDFINKQKKVFLPSLNHSITQPLCLPPQFPALCLLVSGGHTELFLMRDHGQYELIGMTRDDAAGEAFDKVAKLLGLGYPGGPAISKIALEGNPNAIAFPRPMIESGDSDFSFSGLKTAVRVYLEAHPEASVADVAASFQQAVVEILTIKTLAAVNQFSPKSVILSGGVSANRALRDLLSSELTKQFPDVTFHAPDLSLSGDNAAMIAIAGLFRAKQKDFTDPLSLEAQPNLRLV
ncbi:tRNA (adenosine(37)-N6)-threonylcarbamoyltransferase complex transferase subunit TsaD [Candidatus Uhrbacteria bacterium RIFCSPHIGHO2_02_FULL_47_44]|uniref:tRNA N6-adenosine threonylcarbamoyltransferase n=1 Tax=Candidatus Uhrbacteria bacterium RIFCSPLOWO2_02_FULL_48_18 TaxID=1802408 RepID=A0A1F7VCA0_9BACT|nr:MAG: tRNA (adenosine(37)-N6)-threonylcarbamoyltransferase complex transferase subunit TsaD [Candidatus Uhrbacteria bacterium RIFCSPHIGHO2_02_FULL_47_44]OGL77828.1 MAG: tRNA (adenosine(37)-N6)-threonylcarbamoyltransferase complex transferase subunit TsaD [Candidatus Uhrbacteria bacterium RIFCSPHIGHO2_12_FULL_47_12]OGL80647.1 MAG: tRNA (adenosine(37)-N6)-threonylcarbamoyltransferase complex transferase subunit TsaD [Candidatus Uhrbacteria bacterium RIFCSPLOWO2_01_FULL_47_17]OGL88170.1 MAG: tRNA